MTTVTCEIPDQVQTVRILGSEVHMVSIPEVVAMMEQWIRQRDGRCRQIIVAGYQGLWEAHKDPDFHEVARQADLWIPDGIAPVVIAKLRGVLRATRTPGADVMKAFLDRADAEGWRSFFYGDTTDTLARLADELARCYPNHKVVGTFSPPFRSLTAQESAEHVRMINATRPDVVWVGLGLPKQERWIRDHRDQLDASLAVGVGAAFGFLSGKVSRCPDWLGRIGGEWLFRVWAEPGKCWRRSFVDGPKFIFHALLELTGLRKYE